MRGRNRGRQPEDFLHPPGIMDDLGKYSDLIVGKTRDTAVRIRNLVLKGKVAEAVEVSENEDGKKGGRQARRAKPSQYIGKVAIRINLDPDDDEDAQIAFDLEEHIHDEDWESTWEPRLRKVKGVAGCGLDEENSLRVILVLGSFFANPRKPMLAKRVAIEAAKAVDLRPPRMGTIKVILPEKPEKSSGRPTRQERRKRGRN